MFAHYLKWSFKALLVHVLGQLLCTVFYFAVFFFYAHLPQLKLFICLFLSIGYIVFTYSKIYKFGERDTKSYVEYKAFAWKGLLLHIPTLIIGALLALWYATTRSSLLLTPKFLIRPLAQFWGMSFFAFFDAPLFWCLYFLVPLVVCGFGYYAGMKHMEIGYKFFKYLVYRKKDK